MDTKDTNEPNTIKYIAQESEYNPEIIDTILRKVKKQNTTEQHHSEQQHTTARKTRHQTCHINIL